MFYLRFIAVVEVQNYSPYIYYIQKKKKKKNPVFSIADFSTSTRQNLPMLVSSTQRLRSTSSIATSVVAENSSMSAAEHGRQPKSSTVVGSVVDQGNSRPQDPQRSSSYGPTVFSTDTSAPPAAQLSPNNTTPTKRPSWLTNISSRFSSTSNSEVYASGSAAPPTIAIESSPKSHSAQPGFLISTLRRLSSTNARDAFGRRGSATTVSPCDRVVLNRDATRDRCGIPELDGIQLRKVAFCVDVEVAPSNEDLEVRREARRKRREAREKELELEKERGNEKENEKDGARSSKEGLPPETDENDATDDVLSLKDNETESSRRRSLSSYDSKDEHLSGKRKGSETSSTDLETKYLSSQQPSSDKRLSAPVQKKVEWKDRSLRRVHARPTTDPLKIYTQCCQLREAKLMPELKDILTKANGIPIIPSLDLSGYKFQMADVVAFSDFLALVPIKRLILEDCDLTDEMVRIILSALTAVKSKPSMGKVYKPNRGTKYIEEVFPSTNEKHILRGAIERLSLKGNPRIGKDGWKYISCFIHMSHSLKALDLSKILLPRPASVSHLNTGTQDASKGSLSIEIPVVFSRALGQRLCGRGLEELVMGNCSLSTEQLKYVLDGVSIGGTKRLGLGGNGLTVDGLALISRWMKGIDMRGTIHCEALDLSNNDVKDNIKILSSSVKEISSLSALSLSNCNLSPMSLASLLPSLATLPQFRWLDLSNNRKLFSAQPDSLQLLRRFLPRMQGLRKIDLSDTSMTADHAIALCEILPEVKQLAYFKLNNNPLAQFRNSKMDDGSKEEGAALYTALVTAAKVSKSIVRIDVDEPGPSAGGVICGLAKRLLAYCLRNMEAGSSAEDWTIDTPVVSREGSQLDDTRVEATTNNRDLGDDNADFDIDEDGIWRDEESYVVGGTGVVKALGVCLGNKPHNYARPNEFRAGVPALQRTDTISSIGSLSDASGETGQEKANEMSKALLLRARRIKERIQPALRKGSSGEIEEMRHRRLLFLDDTLFRVINRFEEEYPECRETLPPISEPALLQHHLMSTAPLPLDVPALASHDDRDMDDDDSPCPTTTEISKTASRRGSEVSLHSKFLQNEEGQMHKLGQYIKREILPEPHVKRDQQGGECRGGEQGEEDDDEEAAKGILRRAEILRAMEHLEGDELRRRVMEQEGGVDQYIEKIQSGKARRKELRNQSNSTVADARGSGGV